MSDTTYVDGTTLILADAMNDFNRLHYTIFGDPADAATAGLAVARGWVFLSSQTASTSSEIDFSSGLGNTYDTYMITLSNIKAASDDVTLGVRVGTGGGPTYQTTGYTFCGSRGGLAGLVNHGSTTDSITDRIALNGPAGAGVGLGNDTGEQLSGHITVHNPELTDFTLVKFETDYITPSGTPQSIRGSGTGGAQAITALRFFMSTGNIASGVFRLFGLKKS